MSKILRINTREKTHTFEDVSSDLASLGGRGLTAKIILKEVPPTCHPLSKFNKLIVAPGLLSGTAAANSGRISVGAKSPLTGGIKESNSGGVLSQKLAKLGIKAIVLEDKPEEGGFCLGRTTPFGGFHQFFRHRWSACTRGWSRRTRCCHGLKGDKGYSSG